MQDSVASMSREQGFLETFFQSLSQFCYDKAKELAEKEKEPTRALAGSSWNTTLTSLAQLAVVEKSYMSFSFLVSKGFLRKDNSLKSLYELLRSDFRKIEDNGKMMAGESFEKLLGHLSGQLVYFVTYRLELIDLYEKMFHMGASRTGSCDELHSQIMPTIKSSQNNFHHPFLSHLKTSFGYESEALVELLSAQIEMQQWDFFPSILHLHFAHIKLTSWGVMSQQKENRRLSFSPGFLKPTQLPPLYQWLVKLKGFLISKFTLYFHEILSKQTNAQDMKNLCAKAPNDIFHRLFAFQRKTDAVCVALVFDTRGCDRYKGHGYHHPDKLKETPNGLDSFPAVLCYPGEKPAGHWPSIIMTMEDRSTELGTLDRVVCLYDRLKDCTYLIVRVESRMSLVIVFNGKRSEKESHVANFLEDFCSQLRFHRILFTLRPGNK